MVIVYRLTPELRRKLKEPIGVLIRGSFSKTMKKIKNMIEEEKPPKIISVGDTVSENLTKICSFPQLSIVDNRVMRRNIKPVTLATDETFMARNPPGTITDEAITTIRNALKSNRRIKIVVDGEEDLLTLITVLYAPENSLVMYGQPREGVVVVKVTREKKAEVEEILKMMENVSKS